MNENIENGKKLSSRFSLGNVATILTVVIMVGGMWTTQVQNYDNLKYKIESSSENFKAISDRVQLIGVNFTERFGKSDSDTISIGKRIDVIDQDIKSSANKIVILEAEVKALQDEIRVVTPLRR